MSTVLVTGISRGIGLGIARKYLADGHTVIGSVRTMNLTVQELASAHPDTLRIVELDVADRTSVDIAAEAVSKQHSAVDVLICNAGVNPDATFAMPPLSEIDDKDLLDTFDVNVVGPLRTVRAFYPLLKAAGAAKVVVISSRAGSLSQTTNGSMVPYSVSKAAVNMLCRRLAFLLEDDGIPVLALSPGWVKTDMGGPDAKITIEESAEGIAKVIDGFGGDGALFQSDQGDEILW